MKILALIFTLSIATLSCGSDELTKSKVENIIEAKLDAKPFYKYAKIPLKFTSGFEGLSKINFLYEKNGVVKLIKTGSRNGDTNYDLQLTQEGNKYLADGYDYNLNKKYMIILWTNTVKEVQEVHVEPLTNTATVKVEMNRSNITPFGKVTMDEYGTNTTFMETYHFKKTTDGWIWDYKYPYHMKE